MDSTLQPTAAPSQTGFLAHPTGLAVLAFTEAWERFSFYGMQALLTLYMIDHLLRPENAAHVPGLAALRGLLETAAGPLSAGAFASQIFGLYTAAVYVTPVLGSLLADRVLGKTAAIITGCGFMAAGHLAMAFDAGFLPALAALIVGCGLIKGNIASQLGGLYAAGDARRTDAFQIFSMAVALGVIVAPLVCGTLADLWGFHWGFAAAGIGMIVAAGIYLAGRQYLPADLPVAAAGARVNKAMTQGERRALVAQLVLLPLFAVAFVGNNQVYNIYLVWARDAADLRVFGYAMPVTWLVSYDAVISTAMLPLAMWAWRALGRRGISAHELTKITGGAAFAVTGSLMLAAAAAWSASQGVKVPLWALLVFHVVNSLAFVHLLPVGLSLYSRTAAPALNATMLGMFYTLFFGTNLLVGWIGAKYGDVSHTIFSLMQAGLMAVGAAVLGVLYRPLRVALD